MIQSFGSVLKSIFQGFMVYSREVTDHFENPRNVGSFPKGTKNMGESLVGAPQCGDLIKLQLKVENNIIIDVKFKTFGCKSAIASSSLTTEMIKGKTLEEARNIKNMDIAEKLSLPPVKIHCSVLSEEAIKSAITDYEKKHSNH